MASKSCLHPPLLFILFSIFIKSNSTKPCPSFDCGNGITIGYPFWLQSHDQSEYCGYQGFGVSCKEKSAVFNISGNLYKIKTFNEPDKTFTLIFYDTDHDKDQSDRDPGCPVAGHDVILNSSSLIDYASGDVKMMHFFYNCSLYPPSLADISCLRFAAKHSYVFLDGKVPEFDWQKYCDSIVTVPIFDKMANHHQGYGDLVGNGFGKALLEGFKLTWKPNLACQFCEATAGKCGHRTSGISQKFSCFCNNDKQHPSNCQDSGEFSIVTADKPNFTSTGLLIFGGFIVALSVLYHIQKKKISIPRNGFSQLPISGK